MKKNLRNLSGRRVACAVAVCALVECHGALVESQTVSVAMPSQSLSFQHTAPEHPQNAYLELNRAVPIPRFSPGLGTLHRVVVRFMPVVSASAGIENLNPFPMGDDLQGAASLYAIRHGGLVFNGVALTPVNHVAAGGEVSWGAFDGVIDFQGSSGRRISGVSSIPGGPGPVFESEILPGSPGFASFIGTGNIGAVEAFTFSVSAGLDPFIPAQTAAHLNYRAKAAATTTERIEVTYEYFAPGCFGGVLTPARWAQVPSAWPVSGLVIGGTTFDTAMLVTLMNRTNFFSVSGKIARLQQQMAAARFNILSNCGFDGACIEAELDLADEFLAGTLPEMPRVGSLSWNSAMDQLIGPITDYNQGELCDPAAP